MFCHRASCSAASKETASMHTSQRHLNTESNETRSGDQHRITHCAKVRAHALTLDRRASCGTASDRTQCMTYQLAHGITMLYLSHVGVLTEYKYPRSFTSAGLRKQPAIQCAAHPSANHDILHAWLTAERAPCEPAGVRGTGVKKCPPPPRKIAQNLPARGSINKTSDISFEKHLFRISAFLRRTSGSV